MNAGRLSRILVVTLVTAASAFPAAGHDSPEHVIQILTARLEAGGARADLYWRRATEFRALGELSKATADLNKALKLKPDFLAAAADLSRVQLAQGKYRRAISSANRALEFLHDDTDRAAFWMLRAQIFCESGKLEKALVECNRALQARESAEIDWYLTRGQIQSRLGLFEDAARGLQRGFERTGSAVLEVESIEAMIDAGWFSQALAKIEPQLEESRWRSAWLIRRARSRLGTGSVTEAHNDLLAAIRELDLRLQPKRPDMWLLADRGLAYALLGDEPLARHDLNEARKSGADSWMLRRLEGALASK